MDFSFLLRQERNLLSIGYRVEERQLDESCYDLLASEARLASLFAIAKGDIPTNHWFRLGRPIVEIGFSGALMSWSGSMFEYLMPPLVMKEPHGGILSQTSHLIIQRQMQYARSKHIPWGISEAAYNARDREMTYQYTNFGVPGLGLKRGLARNTVIAPYATVLAAQFRPREAVANLERLRSIGGLGHYGFYDAIDFTPQRVPEGADHAIVYNYMAHHQGMSVVAVANVIFEGRMRDRFHSDQVIEAAELLLQEKAPRDILISTVRTEAAERGTVDVAPDHPDTRLILNPALALKATNVMSNGQYSVMVTATGAGYSRFGDISVTRWQADPTEDRMGSFLFLRDAESGAWWSATAEPKSVEGETAQTHFSDGKASFVKTVGAIRSEVECIVVSEGNGEGRRITIWNDGDADRHVEVTSFAELALAPADADSAHPAFSKMFVRNRDRRRQQRHLRAPASALARRTGHRACAFRRGQFRLAARHRSRNRPPRLPRPRPIDRRSGSAAAGRQADRQRRLRARSGHLAAPAGARPGPQEGDGDVLDGGRQGARRSRGDDVAAAASRELRAPDDAVMDPLASADPPCRAVARRRGKRAAAGPLPALSRRLHASAGAGARSRPRARNRRCGQPAFPATSRSLR